MGVGGRGGLNPFVSLIVKRSFFMTAVIYGIRDLIPMRIDVAIFLLLTFIDDTELRPINDDS